MSDQNIEKKIRRRRLIRFYWILIGIAVVIAIIAGAYYYWTQIVYTGYDVKQETNFVKSEEAYIKALGDSVLIYSRDGMSCINSKGKTVWNQTYEIQNPVVRTCKNVAAISDYNGRDIYIASSEKILGTVHTSMPIRDFTVAANGMVAVVQDDEAVTGIYLYDSTGKNSVYFKTTMNNSGYPVALDISEDGRQVAISFLKAEVGEISTNVAFYNFSSVGQNYADNLVGGYGYQNEVIPMISFMNNETIFALGDKKLIFYQGKQIPVNINDIWIDGEIKGVFYDENFVGLVCANSTGETKYQLSVYDTTGHLKNKLNFDLEYQNITFDSNGIIIYNESECEIYNWKNYLKYQGMFTEPISYIVPTNSVDRFIFVTKESVQSVQLK